MALPRNKTFLVSREPTFRRTNTLELRANKVNGPVAFLNPTEALFEGKPSLRAPTCPKIGDTSSAAEATEP